MKITIISSHFSNIFGGGEAERAIKLYQSLKKQKVDVKVITFKGSSILNKDVIEIPFFKLRVNIPILKISKINFILNDSDIVHIMGHWSLLNAIFFPFLYFKNIPYVVCAAGSLTIWGRSKFLKNIFNFVIGKFIIKNAAKCIMIVNDEEKSYLKFGINKEKLSLIPNGIIKEEAVFKNSGHKNAKIVNSLGKYILFIGRLNPIKGVDILLSAFEKIIKDFPDFNLVIAGPDEGILNDLIQYAKKNKFHKKLKYVGEVDKFFRSTLIQNCQTMVIPSRKEAMSIVFLEGAIHKKCVLISEECGLNELKKYDEKIFFKCDANNLSVVLSRCLSDHNWRKNIGIFLYKYTMKHYAWSFIIQNYLQLFEEIKSKNIIEDKKFYLFIRTLYHFYKSRSFKKIDSFPVSTHFPILIGISSLFKITHVYETGSGIYSTGIFSNKKIFKNLISLNSLENDKNWFDKIKKNIKKLILSLLKDQYQKMFLLNL